VPTDLLPSPAHPRAVPRYSLAVLIVAFAACLRIWPLHQLGSGLPWLTFYPAMMIAALYGGFAAGLLTTALSCLTVAFLWPLLVAQPFITGAADYVRMFLFFLVGVTISGLTEATFRAKARAERSARALAVSEQFIRTITDSLPGMVAYWDKNLRCRYANQPYRVWFGRSSQDMLGMPLQELLGEQVFALNEPYIRGALAGNNQQFERALIKQDGSIGHTLANYVADIKAGGEVAGFFVLVSDVTPIKQAEGELKLAASVFHSTVEGIVVTDADQVILSVNPAFSEITGYAAEEAIGRTPRILKSNHHDRAFYAAMWREIDATGRWQGEIWNRRKDGEVFLEWQTITKIRGSGDEPVRYISVFHDITKFRQDDERMRHLAFHDALTNLPNRSLLLNRLDHQLAKAEREQSRLAVLFLDLDRFKAVNDSLGHDIGDELLRRVAQKLQAQVRQSDTVSRLGGDEFVILLDDPASQEELVQILQRIILAINEPMEFKGRTAQVGISIGIAQFPADGRSPGELIKRADTAMYAAKQAGRNSYRFCEPAVPEGPGA